MKVTWLLISTSALLFFFGLPIERTLFFDETRFESLISDYRKQPSTALLSRINQTSFWPGLYAIALEEPLPSKPYPLFEKINEGQIWRLFSPILLHGSLIHLFMNITWLYFLGKLVEERLGSGRYLLLILSAALISNIAQYLVSGAHFLGLSGIVMSLVGFLWVRLMKGENWGVPKTTVVMIGSFALLGAALQTLFFTLQFFGLPTYSTYLANTAHLFGAATGMVISLILYHRKEYHERS